MQVLGWSVEVTKDGQKSNRWHLIVDDDPGHPSRAQAACTKKIKVDSEVHKNPTEGGSVCKRCAILASRLKN